MHRAAVIRTPEDSVEDGFIKNEQAVADAIGASLKANRFEARTAVFELFSSRIASKEVMLPDMKEKKLTDMIAANASDYFPVNIDEYIVTHKSLETIVGEDKSKQQRVLVYAAPKEMVMTCFNIGYKLGLYVDRVDYAGNSVVQVAQREIGTESTMVVHIQEDNSTINILENNVLQLQRIVPYGKNMIVQALAEIKEVDLAEAEEMLAADELIHSSFDGDELTDSLRYMLNNISRVVDYYVSRHQGVPIKNLYLTGASTELSGIEKLFENEFEFEVTANLPMNNVVISAELMMPQEFAGRFIVNLGAGISPADFIPKEEVEKAKKDVDFKLLNLAFVGAVLIAAIIVLIPLAQLLSMKSQRNTWQQRVDSISDVEQVVSDYYTALDKDTDVQAFSLLTQNADDSLLTFLEDLEDVIPSDMQLSSLSVSSGSVSMSGTASSKDSVAKLLLVLKDISYVSDVNSGALSEAVDESGNTEVSFSVSCTFTKVADEK
jgi:type IV pilus assembly protein PilM